MNAGFFRRAFSSLVDITLVFLVVYLSFITFGRTILRNQVPDFDEIYTAYQEILDAYNSDLAIITEEYSAAVELADGNETLEAEAKAAYDLKYAQLNTQNEIDIEPYNRPLSAYFLSTVYYYAIAFLILMTIYSIVVNGKTLGRRLMQIKLEGPVHSVTVFFHDIVFKYFFIVIVFVISMYAGLILFMVSLLVDMVFLSFSRRRATLRDILLKINVVKAGYGY